MNNNERMQYQNRALERLKEIQGVRIHENAPVQETMDGAFVTVQVFIKRVKTPQRQWGPLPSINL